MLFLVGVVGAFTSHFSKAPDSDKEWAAHFEKTNTATKNTDGTVTLRNIRNWNYKDGEIVSREWLEEVTVHPEGLKTVWFLLEPFPEWSRVGHTYLTFEFEDGTALSFSVEARMESGEYYSAFKGLLREYELAYTWGTEEDFLLRRTELLDHEVYMYPLSIQHETAVTIFNAVLDGTNDIAKRPRFYNTLTANCTNVIAEIVNEHYKEQLPYDISWNLPGTSDAFLIEQGYIKTDTSLEETRINHAMAKRRAELNQLGSEFDGADFSRALRGLSFPEGSERIEQ